MQLVGVALRYPALVLPELGKFDFLAFWGQVSRLPSFFGAAAKSSVPLSDLAVPFPDLAVPLWKSSVPLFLAVGSMFVRPYGYGSTPPWVAVGVCGVGVPVSVLAASPAY